MIGRSRDRRNNCERRQGGKRREMYRSGRADKICKGKTFYVEEREEQTS